MRSSVKQDQKWVLSMAAGVPLTWLIVGQKKARKSGSLCRFYNAQEALDMGLVSTVVPLADLEKRRYVGVVKYCNTALWRFVGLKAALNADCDGQAGLQELAGNATMLFYMTDEGAGRT